MSHSDILIRYQAYSAVQTDNEEGIGQCRSKKPHANGLLAVLSACLGSLAFGFSLGYTSPSGPELIQLGLLTDDQLSWFGSILNIGAILGGPACGYFADFAGRKLALMSCSVPYTLGWLLIAYAPNAVMLYCGRAIAGFGLGWQTMVVPLYIAEISTKEHRGVMGTLNQLFLVFGVCIVFALGIWFPWRWLAIVAAVPPILLLITISFMPETPSWLLRNHREIDAMRSLSWLRGDEQEAKAEFDLMKEHMDKELGEHAEGLSCSDFTLPSTYKPFIIGVLLLVFQQAGGVNAVTFYMVRFFNAAGLSGYSYVIPVLVSSCQIPPVFISAVLVDRLGRRPLLVIGGFLMAASCAGIGAYFYCEESGNVAYLHWLPITCLIAYNGGFAFAWGSVPYVLLSEIFPPKVRGLGIGLSVAACWLTSFLVTKYFAGLEAALHTYGAFWLFAGICLLSVIFAWTAVPETKGKSLDDIQDYFEGNREVRI